MTFHIKEDQGPASSRSLRNNVRASGAQAGMIAGATAGDASGRDQNLIRSILENKVLNSEIEDPRELLNRKRRVLNVVNFFI